MAEKKQKIAPRYGSLKVSPEERLRIDALELRLKQERGGAAITQTEIVKYLLDQAENPQSLYQADLSSDSIGSYSTAIVDMADSMVTQIQSLTRVVQIVAEAARRGSHRDEEKSGAGRGKHRAPAEIKRA